jgi:hypothetical protein
VETNSKQNILNLKWLYIVCCMASKVKSNNNYEINGDSFEKNMPKMTKEEEAIKAANDAKEESFWKSFNNVCAILMIVIAGFY